MDASSDHPLALPLRTLDAIDLARSAVRRTRHTVEVSLARFFAGIALGVVGMGSSMLCSVECHPAWATWPLAVSASLLALGGLVLIYWSIWSWIRRGRLGGRQSPLSDGCTQLSTRRRFGFFAFVALLLTVEQVGFQALHGHIPDAVFYGIMIWGTRLAVLMGVAFFVYRFVRSGFWEHLVFAAGIAGTAGLYIFFNPGQMGTVAPLPTSIAALSMSSTLLAAVSLVGRWRRWTRASQAAEAIKGPASTEVA